jgi:pimeloyl-ACP methyl ester carboxylesterase
MLRVTSKDGTTIAYDRLGSGPPLILVDGALCYRAMGPNPPLAKLLADRFTVYTYDRRGRGESSNGAVYAVQREVEDIEALIGEAGGSAHLYGISSGAVLALEASQAGLPVRKLALYEAPFMVDDTRKPVPADYLGRLNRMLAEDQRGAAVKHFMKNAVGLPGWLVALFGLMPGWSKTKAAAHTLPYDAMILGDTVSCKPLPMGRWAAVKAATLVISGGKSPQWIRNANAELAAVLPNARHSTLVGQTHMVKPAVLAPMLEEFFGA